MEIPVPACGVLARDLRGQYTFVLRAIASFMLTGAGLSVVATRPVPRR